MGPEVPSGASECSDNTEMPIAVLDVDAFPIQRHWYIVYPKGRKRSVVGQAFIDFVRQEGIHIAEKLDREIKKLHHARTAGPNLRKKRKTLK